jgi:hypothetical protein
MMKIKVGEPIIGQKMMAPVKKQDNSKWLNVILALQRLTTK